MLTCMTRHTLQTKLLYQMADNVTVCDEAKVRGAKLYNNVVDADIGSNLTILADTVLGRGVRITGYIGRDAIIKTKV